MRALLLVLVMAACGRSGFTETTDADPGPPDLTPDPINWTDFTNVSTLQTISGTNREIELRLQASFGVGTPATDYRVDVGTWIAFSPATPTSVMLAPNATLQFRVGGNVDDTAFITITNTSTGDTLLDTVRGIVGTPVSGSGAPSSPYTAPGVAPASCAAFLAAYGEQTALDGSYNLDPGTPLVAYCDMTTEGGGWTLVARVLGTSTTHTTATAIGSVDGPAQATTAKFADAMMTTFGFTSARFVIETVGTVYARVARLDLSGTVEYTVATSAAPALAGPYTFGLVTSLTCNSDCGVATVIQNMGFGAWCGYRYIASQGNPRNGMGCKGAFGKNGTVWVK